MTLESDKKWMRMALDLAAQAEGETSPNPCVGAVLTRDDQLIGRGYHRKAGGPHAEVEALRDAGERARGATCYVTLEPCCFFGKTPACTEALIKAGVSRVVFAVLDPNPRVAGKGMHALEEAGIKVHAGVLKAEATFINRHFFHFIQTGLPFVTLKYAMTADGKIATSNGDSKWITGPASRQEVHRLRHHSDAILVGAGTIRSDDPQLNVRLPDKKSYPIKVILDDELGLDPSYRVFENGPQERTWLFTSHLRPEQENSAFHEKGTQVLNLPHKHDITHVLKYLGDQKIMHLMVEGGSQVAGHFIAENKVQEIWTFMGARIFGGSMAPGPIGDPGFREVDSSPFLKIIETRQIDQDVLVKYAVGGEGHVHGNS